MQQRQQTGGRGKAYLFLGVSLIAAVIAAVLVVKLIDKANRQLEEARKPKETVDVVVATRTLYMGLPVAEGDVVVRGMAPEMVPADVVFTSVDMLIGRTPKERILVNEIVRAERLARREAGIGLNALINPGKRAVAIAVKAEEAVAGFIQPGNDVDLIVVIRPDDKSTGVRAVSKTLLQGIKVLAVGSSLSSSDEPEEPDPKAKRRSSRDTGVVKGKRTVTLEVTPTDAESIALSVAEGDITLVLRADIDIEQVVTNGVVADQLVGVDVESTTPSTTMRAKPRNTTPAPPAVPQEAGPTVVSGSNVQQLEVTEGGAIKETDKRKKR